MLFRIVNFWNFLKCAIHYTDRNAACLELVAPFAWLIEKQNVLLNTFCFSQYILLFYQSNTFCFSISAMREEQLTLTLARYFLLEQAQRLKLFFHRNVVSTTSARHILVAAVRIRLLIRLRMLVSLQPARLSQSGRDSPSA